MKQKFKDDWEMSRVFLVLAILTLGFVWGFQKLILTPGPTSGLSRSISGKPAQK